MTKIKEIWKDIQQFKGYYQVSNLGRVRSISRKVKHGTYGDHFTRNVPDHIMSPQLLNKYLAVKIHHPSFNGFKSIHRLVAKTFVPNPEKKPCVNHKNLNKIDNTAINLEWVTHKENTRHAYDNAAMTSKLDHLQVKTIRDIHNSKKLGCVKLARYFNVNKSTILNIVHGRTWKN